MPRVLIGCKQQSVRFFPTVYFNQLSMPPLAEYAVLHTFLLSGAGRLVNLVQFSGYVAAVVASSLAAKELGGGREAQWLAAMLPATLPGAILQASGAKNDCLLAALLEAVSKNAPRHDSATLPADSQRCGTVEKKESSRQ